MEDLRLDASFVDYLLVAVAEAVRSRFDASGYAAPRTFDVVPAAGARRIR